MYDFFSRGLRQWEHYIPIRPSVLAAPELCDALDKGVEFGEANQTEVNHILNHVHLKYETKQTLEFVWRPSRQSVQGGHAVRWQ